MIFSSIFSLTFIFVSFEMIIEKALRRLCEHDFFSRRKSPGRFFYGLIALKGHTKIEESGGMRRGQPFLFCFILKLLCHRHRCNRRSEPVSRSRPVVIHLIYSLIDEWESKKEACCKTMAVERCSPHLPFY